MFSTFAYLLLWLLRRWGLTGTKLARAQCGTIRLKLLRIGALLRISVRPVVVALTSGYPEKDVFAQVHALLTG